MKTTKYIMALAAASLMLTSACSDDFLDVKNNTGEPLEEYYTTQEHIDEALVAAYDPLHWPDWGLDQYNALNIDAEVLGDNFWVGGSDKNDMKNWHMLFNFEADAENTYASLWTVDYSGVKRCNDLLKYLGWAVLTDSARVACEYQARALRVYYYNNLWHYFGNIPFFLENLTSPYTAPQLKADEVYENLIVELEQLADDNKLPFRWDDKNCGRISQAMIYMMYAEMVMYQNDQARYPKALEYMKKIINSSDYDLVSDYASIWETAGEWSKEAIWEINYNDANNERGWSSPLAIGGTVMPTLISPNGWKGEGLTQDGWGFLPVRLETLNKFSAGDKRLDATVWDLRDIVEYNNRYQDTHLWLKKYRAQDANNAAAKGDMNLNYNNNLRVYRYAEALLNAAELILPSDPAQAAKWVSLVRERAGLKAVSSVTLDDIINERDLEFMGEGKRYFDLVRTGKAASVLVPDTYGYRTNTWNPTKKYIPIAQAELDSDPALVQNEY